MLLLHVYGRDLYLDVNRVVSNCIVKRANATINTVKRELTMRGCVMSKTDLCGLDRILEPVIWYGEGTGKCKGVLDNKSEVVMGCVGILYLSVW
jgi:hypothetical protein